MGFKKNFDPLVKEKMLTYKLVFIISVCFQIVSPCTSQHCLKYSYASTLFELREKYMNKLIGVKVHYDSIVSHDF